MVEQKCERIHGKCELCGAEGVINRYSRPVEGYEWYSKDGAFTFKKRTVQQICDPCLARSIVNWLDASDARTRARILKELNLLFGKHGYKIVQNDEEKRDKPTA